jgi:hypothetical protein
MPPSPSYDATTTNQVRTRLAGGLAQGSETVAVLRGRPSPSSDATTMTTNEAIGLGALLIGVDRCLQKLINVDSVDRC